MKITATEPCYLKVQATGSQNKEKRANSDVGGGKGKIEPFQV